MEGLKVINDPEYYTGDRLPKDVAPEHYKLTLCSNLKNFTFDDLEITDGHVIDVENIKINLKKIIYNSERETASLIFDNDNFNPKQMSLHFKGFMNDKMRGFYRSKFRIENQDASLVCTQFCSTDARRAFPCFDEPVYKASFELIMIYDSNLIIGDKSYKQIALSNCKVINESTTESGKTITEFDITPNMSTYLLAFVIGPIEYLESPITSENKSRIRVYTTLGKKELGQFALEMATKALLFYQDYFDIEYPLSKLDLVAVPDLPFGAMENWGLITFRETVLLQDSQTTSTAAKQYIALVIAHEIAHQWFGNYVTMAWWNDIWLNEGFASFMQYLCTDSIFPEWGLWSQFVADMWSPAMHKDSLYNSHPVEVPVNREFEINENFDEISYKKGCSIIRMLYNYLGDDEFRVGMNDYLEKYSYVNARTLDLWKCLGRVSDKPIAEMMSTWTSKMGYPWIKVDLLLKTEYDYDKKPGDMIISLEQQRFTSNGVPDCDGREKTIWMVPISVESGSPDVPLINEFLEESKNTYVIPNQGKHWIKLNKNTIGFYRTAYSPILLNRLVEIMKEDFITKASNDDHTERLSPMDRFGILDDYLALCRAGHVRTGELIRLMASFQNETHYTVWKCINECVSCLCVIFRSTEYYEHFLSFARQLYQRIYSKLTWESKEELGHTTLMLRSLVIESLVSFEDEEVNKIAKKYFSEQMYEDKQIPPDLRAAVYVSIAINGSDAEFNELYNIHRKSQSSEEKLRVVKALASTKNITRLLRVREFLMSDEVRNQDKLFGFASIARNDPPYGWVLFKGNVDYFKQIYASGTMMSRLIKHSTECLAALDHASDIKTFFRKVTFPQSERTINQSIETVILNSEWRGRLDLDGQLLASIGDID